MMMGFVQPTLAIYSNVIHVASINRKPFSQPFRERPWEDPSLLKLHTCTAYARNERGEFNKTTGDFCFGILFWVHKHVVVF